MDIHIKALIDDLESLKSQLSSTLSTGQPLYAIAGNPAFCGYNSDDFCFYIDEISEILRSTPDGDWTSEHGMLLSHKDKIQYVRTTVLPSLLGNQNVAFTLLTILWSTRRYVERFSTSGEHPAVSLRKAALQVRSLEARLRDQTPRAEKLDEFLASIEKAFQTAEKLPVDYEQLVETQKSIKNIVEESSNDKKIISANRIASELMVEAINELEKKSSDLIKSLDKAYAAATSHGLAAAFEKKHYI